MTGNDPRQEFDQPGTIDGTEKKVAVRFKALTFADPERARKEARERWSCSGGNAPDSPAIPCGYRVSAGSVGLVEQTIFQILDPYDARYRHIVAICALVGEKQINRFRASHDHAGGPAEMVGSGPLIIIVEKAEVIAAGLPRPEVQREALPVAALRADISHDLFNFLNVARITGSWRHVFHNAKSIKTVKCRSVYSHHPQLMTP